MFSSKTPRDLNRPEGKHPFGRDCSSKCKSDAGFNQHNEPNPILVDFRVYAGDAATGHYRVTPSWLAGHWTKSDEMWQEVTTLVDGSLAGTPAQIDHARRVLERLARLEQS